MLHVRVYSTRNTREMLCVNIVHYEMEIGNVWKSVEYYSDNWQYAIFLLGDLELIYDTDSC